MPKILTVAHTKGGVGKSTLAWNIATALAAKGLSVVVFDLDFQKTLFFVDRLRCHDPVAPLSPLGVRTINDADAFHSAVADSSAEYIVCDVGGFDSALNREVVTASDVVLCPLKDSIHEVLGFHAFAAVLEAIGSPEVLLCINGAHPNSGNFDELLEAVAVYPRGRMLSTVVRFRAAFARAMARGRGVVEWPDMSYYSKAAADIYALTDELLEVCDG